MVRKGIAEQIAEMSPEPQVDHRFDMVQVWRRHQEYWLPEAVAERKRFEAQAGGLHIQDGFRIVCDGQVGGQDCGNVIGYAETFRFDTHDGLCASCRASYADFPPRYHMTPDGVYAMLPDGPGIIRRQS